MDRRLIPPLLAIALAACGGAVPTTLPSADAGLPPPSDAHADARADATPPPVAAVVLLFGANVPPAVQTRATELVTELAPLSVMVASEVPTALTSDSLVLAFGDTAVARGLIPADEVAGLGPEGFIVRSGVIAGAPLLAADGNRLDEAPAADGSLGAAFGAYALLEELGFAFLHPLRPTRPVALQRPTAPVDRRERPRWPVRGIHLHTMHPLELTDLLQGFGPSGPADEDGWRAMLPEWRSTLEWMVANRQNRLEWVLLWAGAWADFADSAVRQARLAELVDAAHEYGLLVGIDAPLALAQQHAFRLVRTTGDAADELAQIRTRLDWIMAAGFDFVGTESGTSEFTHPDPAQQLAWMNEFARHLDEAHGARADIKIHCSTGQIAEGYPDPETGAPINFNFLPHYADPRLGIMPHTVQHYGLTDPAPTYGNTNFAHVRQFLAQEVGARPVVWHPETAYWVSFDVDVPLFLPLYAERRVADLRLLAGDEAAGRLGRGPHAGGRMDGQMIFSSGWEWGYWLNDVVAARAAWDPGPPELSGDDAFRRALTPVVAPFGAAGPDVAAWLVDVATAERALLIEGRVNGAAPPTVVRRNGQAYLQGFEAYDDISERGVSFGVGGVQMTQPARLGLVDLRNPLHGPPDYADLEPLLAEMEARLGALANRAAALRAGIPPGAADLFDDLADAARLTALRAVQVHGLYDYVAGYWTVPDAERRARLQTARDALDAAAALVVARESRYRVPADRVAAWRGGPTAYRFGYLWTVRSLYFWWRDEGKAVDVPLSPCYLNLMDPAEIGLGEGTATDLVDVITQIAPSFAAECLTAPAAAPTFPQDDLRTRP